MHNGDIKKEKKKEIINSYKQTWKNVSRVIFFYNCTEKRDPIWHFSLSTSKYGQEKLKYLFYFTVLWSAGIIDNACQTEHLPTSALLIPESEVSVITQIFNSKVQAKMLGLKHTSYIYILYTFKHIVPGEWLQWRDLWG